MSEEPALKFSHEAKIREQMRMNDQIYIALMDEGTNVWRPTPALRLEDNSYVVLKPDDYDPLVEHWEFPPGTIVVCETKKTSDGSMLAAVRLKQGARRTA
jgi:hypothetical protein